MCPANNDRLGLAQLADRFVVEIEMRFHQVGWRQREPLQADQAISQSTVRRDGVQEETHLAEADVLYAACVAIAANQLPHAEVCAPDNVPELKISKKCSVVFPTFST